MDAWGIHRYLQCQRKIQDLNLSLELTDDTFSLTSKSGTLGRFTTIDSLWYYLLGVERGREKTV